jgi:hypothetical protein
MKLSLFVLALVVIVESSVAHSQNTLRHVKTPPKKANQKRHKGNDARILPVALPYGKPGRIGSRAHKVCGKAKNGKAKPPRQLFPCVDYGDPGDDPIDKDPPSVAPSSPPTADVNRAASGSNKDADVDLDYEPYEASGSNDRKPDIDDGQDREADPSDGSGGFVDIDPSFSPSPGVDDDPEDDNDQEKVPSNDELPSNDR